MVYLAELLVVMTDRLKIVRIRARNVPRVQGHNRLDDDWRGAIMLKHKQEVKVIWQKAPHGGPIPRLEVTTGGRKLYHWIPGVGFPISVP